MRALVVAVAVLATMGSIALAAPKPAPKAPPPPDAAGPPTSIKNGARIARVRIEVTPGGASIAHDLIFPKDALAIGAAGEPTLFVAFTAQARPLAIEATKHALDANGAIVESGATKLEVIDVAVKPKTAALLLGPAVQAGHVIRLPRDGSPFGLRVRSAIATQEIGKSISLMARLGVRDQKPMPLESIEVGSALGASLRGARATFCGKGADPRPLTLSFVGYPSPPGDAGTIVPTAALRTVEDDLCVDVLL
ncbi:MAG: hypothetical protein ACXWUG_04205 [Polyangiales bacterium]